MTRTEAACKDHNERKGLTRNQVGYIYYADVKGNGRKAVWAVINENGGVTRSGHNQRSAAATIASINRA